MKFQGSQTTPFMGLADNKFYRVCRRHISADLAFKWAQHFHIYKAANPEIFRFTGNLMEFRISIAVDRFMGFHLFSDKRLYIPMELLVWAMPGFIMSLSMIQPFYPIFLYYLETSSMNVKKQRDRIHACSWKHLVV